MSAEACTKIIINALLRAIGSSLEEILRSPDARSVLGASEADRLLAEQAAMDLATLTGSPAPTADLQSYFDLVRYLIKRGILHASVAQVLRLDG